LAIRPPKNAIQVDSQHFASMSEEGILNFFADGLPMPERRVVFAVEGQIYGPMFDEKTDTCRLEVETFMACDRNE